MKIFDFLLLIFVNKKMCKEMMQNFQSHSCLDKQENSILEYQHGNDNVDGSVSADTDGCLDFAHESAFGDASTPFSVSSTASGNAQINEDEADASINEGVSVNLQDQNENDSVDDSTTNTAAISSGSASEPASEDDSAFVSPPSIDTSENSQDPAPTNEKENPTTQNSVKENSDVEADTSIDEGISANTQYQDENDGVDDSTANTAAISLSSETEPAFGDESAFVSPSSIDINENSQDSAPTNEEENTTTQNSVKENSNVEVDFTPIINESSSLMCQRCSSGFSCENGFLKTCGDNQNRCFHFSFKDGAFEKGCVDTGVTIEKMYYYRNKLHTGVSEYYTCNISYCNIDTLKCYFCEATGYCPTVEKKLCEDTKADKCFHYTYNDGTVKKGCLNSSKKDKEELGKLHGGVTEIAYECTIDYCNINNTKVQN